ncbi:ATP-binding protein [Streptomyces sp. NPDC003016]
MQNDEEAPWEYMLYVPHDPRAVSVCRRTLRLVLTTHHLAHLADRAELLASELISNAIAHTDGPAALRLLHNRGVLRLGAWDTDPGPPEPRRAADGDENGRGLDLVRSYADAWGWFPLTAAAFGSSGKYVWCEVAAAG